MSVDYYEVWCDGSYRRPHNAMGLGWVIRALDKTLTGYSVTPPQLNGHEKPDRIADIIGLKIKPDEALDHGSDIAELFAFAGALGKIPDGSKVRVHMDCENVLKWLENGHLDNKDKLKIRQVARAFELAMQAKERMREVTFLYTSDNTSQNMGAAHRLSRAASSKQKSEPANAYKNSRRPPRPRRS